MGAEARSELERDLRRREESPAAMGDVFSSVIGALDEGGRARSTWSVGRAWYAVNGDIERAHTTGVFVREPAGRQNLFTLVVYVDSRSRATDFNANREVYQARLERVGLHFEEISFLPSNRPAARTAIRERAAGPAPAPIAPADAEKIERLTDQVPERLRESVSRAMRATWERSASQDS